MFLRQKASGGRVYLRIVENRWEAGKVRQRVIATLGRLEALQQSGELDGLVRSAARFCEALLVLRALQEGDAPTVCTRRIGPPLVFERLWQQTGCQQVIDSLVQGRQFGFSVERAVFLTVLHRLFHRAPARVSDRAAEGWRACYPVAGASGEELGLHRLYRAMAWQGEQLPEAEQGGRTPWSTRTIKDLVEERLFERRRDLFSEPDLVFFDTTSIYFEGEGGQTLGRHGKSKDHRPDLRQMVVGAVLDGTGRPVCCELWPGNTADVKTLVPVAQRLRRRFGVGRVCLVADRGMFSTEAMAGVEELGWQYILGARMRRWKEVRDQVLSRPGRYREVRPPSGASKDPWPLKVKQVWVGEHRYVVCLNEDRKQKDAADRAAIIASLREKLRQGDKSLVGNKGYRKYLASQGQGFEVDEEAIKREARYDGKWVLRTNTDLSSEEVALKYKELRRVEDVFRTTKSLPETRPIYHKCDETIRGHVFCSFLALVLRWELQQRLEVAGHHLSWDEVVRDLDEMTETEVEHEGKRFVLRETAHGACGAVFQSVGLALPPTVRQVPVPA
jgi:transposase